MAGRKSKRPSPDVLRSIHAAAVAQQVSPTEAAAMVGACLKTLRQWWKTEGLPSPCRARMCNRQAIICQVLESHPDARRSEVLARVQKQYPRTTARTVYMDFVRLKIPTLYVRRRTEIRRLMWERPLMTRAEVHADMNARGWSACITIVGEIMQSIREEEMEHYQRQTAERALIVNQRHTLIRQLLDEHPDATDGELSELMAAKGCPAAEKTVGHDRRTMGIDAVYTRKLAEVRYYAVTWPSLTAEEIRASMSNDGWRLNLRSVARLLAKVREETAAQAA